VDPRLDLNILGRVGQAIKLSLQLIATGRELFIEPRTGMERLRLQTRLTALGAEQLKGAKYLGQQALNFSATISAPSGGVLHLQIALKRLYRLGEASQLLIAAGNIPENPSVISQRGSQRFYSLKGAQRHLETLREKELFPLFYLKLSFAQLWADAREALRKREHEQREAEQARAN